MISNINSTVGGNDRKMMAEWLNNGGKMTAYQCTAGKLQNCDIVVFMMYSGIL